jgi:hypothetical protein
MNLAKFKGALGRSKQAVLRAYHTGYVAPAQMANPFASVKKVPRVSTLAKKTAYRPLRGDPARHRGYL